MGGASLLCPDAAWLGDSGFNVHRSRRVLPEQREDIERLAQYIIRNPVSPDKMQVNEPDRRGLDGSVISVRQ